MQCGEVRIYKSGRLVESMGVEPMADARKTLEWVLADIARSAGNDGTWTLSGKETARIVKAGNF